jgi:hypothetical protein
VSDITSEGELSFPAFDFVEPEPEPDYNPYAALEAEEAVPEAPSDPDAALKEKIAALEARVAAFPQTVTPQAPQPFYPQPTPQVKTQEQIEEEYRTAFYADPGKAALALEKRIEELAEKKAREMMAPAMQSATESTINSFKSAHANDPLFKAASKKFEEKLATIPVTQRVGINSEVLSLLYNASVGEYYQEQASKPKPKRDTPTPPPYSGASARQTPQTAPPRQLSQADQLAVREYKKMFPSATNKEIVEMLENG